LILALKAKAKEEIRIASTEYPKNAYCMPVEHPGVVDVWSDHLTGVIDTRAVPMPCGAVSPGASVVLPAGKRPPLL
jgi:hypothetical protein